MARAEEAAHLVDWSSGYQQQLAAGDGQSPQREDALGEQVHRREADRRRGEIPDYGPQATLKLLT